MVRDLVADDKPREGTVILDTNASRAGTARFRTLRQVASKCLADTSYEATHQKTITVDGTESLILSANLTEEYYSTTRDFASSTTTRRTSAQSSRLRADFAHEPITPSNGSDLVWSPGSQARCLGDRRRESLPVD